MTDREALACEAAGEIENPEIREIAIKEQQGCCLFHSISVTPRIEPENLQPLAKAVIMNYRSKCRRDNGRY